MTWFESDNPNGYTTGRRSSVDSPAPTVMAAGMAGDSYGHRHIMTDHRPDPAPAPDPTSPDGGKPPYRVPSMAEIDAVAPNGFRVASLFSGCGGSSLGYRMAGFRVVWANEFTPEAQRSYRANSPHTHLDTRDLCLVRPEDILDATGLAAGQIDILDGSPPCQPFSAAGKRDKGWNARSGTPGVARRKVDLFFEYVRILRGLRPRCFVAENVGGLVRGTAKGYFKRILDDLKGSGYRVGARLLDAQWLGVPQSRQRIIFVGVRDDLGLDPPFPSPLPYRYTVRDACPWIARVGFDLQFSGGDTEANRVWKDSAIPMRTVMASIRRMPKVVAPAVGVGAACPSVEPDPDIPCPTMTAASGRSGLAGVTRPTEKRKFSIAELRRICAFPDDFVLTGSYAQQWMRLGNSVPPLMMKAVAEAVRDHVLIRVPAGPPPPP